jgi:23S rRNA pseudouridine1911/1915/1917 synthase
MTERLAVLYEDEHVLAVAKPAGLLTQGRTGEPTLESAVRAYLSPTAAGAGYLATVHRLDCPVSGVVLWAKTSKAARRLSAQFAGREIVKEYWAVVEPRPSFALPAEGLEGTWDDWLVRSPDALGVVRKAAADAKRARRAVTRFRVARGPEAAASWPAGAGCLQFWPVTGRTHQLRAQARIHGLVIWGDTVYGATKEFPQGIALHARFLTFHHPTLQQEVAVAAPVPPAWSAQGFDLPDDLTRSRVGNG